MTRHAPRDSHERASGLMSRIAGTSSLLQPYVPGRRLAARAHTLTLAAQSHSRPATSLRSDPSSGQLAALLERFSAAPDLEGALHLLAAELPAALDLERVVVALEEPHLAVDSRTLSPAVPEPGAPPVTPPVTPARVTRPLWLVPRQPAASGDTLEVPIEASRERLGLLRAWVAAGDTRPVDALLASLRIVCVAVGQQALLARPRSAAQPPGDNANAALSPGERQRWNALLEYVAHEVKTPLTCIQGHEQLLSRYVRAARSTTKAKRGMLAHLLDDCERHLPALEKQVTRIEQLLRDTLDLARSDDGGLPLIRSRTDLAELLSRVARRLETELACAIVVEAPETLEVLCDAARIEQVLGDLLREMAHGVLERDLRVSVIEVAEGDTHLAYVAIGSEQEKEPEVSLAALEPPNTSSPFAIFGTDSAAFPLDLRLALSAAILRQHGGFLRCFSGATGMRAMVLALPSLETHPIQTGERHGAPNPHRRR